MGQLIADDTDRSASAGPYLEKALALRDVLPGAMVTEAEELLRRVGR